MRVLPMRVRLPDFKDRVGYRYSVAVEQMAFNSHALSGCAGAYQVIVNGRSHTDGEERADGLRCGSLPAHFKSPWAGRRAWKIHLRDQARCECCTEKRKVDMCGAPGVVMISPGIRSGADGHESIAPLRVCERVSASGEVRIQRSIVLVALMQIPAGGVSLPDLDE